MPINILAIGDVAGSTGLDFLLKKLYSIKKQNNIAFTVVNGENAAVFGITRSKAQALLDGGADVITLGNHTWGRRDIIDFLDDSPYILRPANYAPQNPGRGWGIYHAPFGEVCVINLIGRCHMDFGNENPFIEADKILGKIKAKVTLVDFHAEATSEKLALAFHLDGRVSALWGTHTHVQTSDACVFPKGMGYISDLGMTGPALSVIGIKPEQSVSRFLGNPPQRYESASGNSKIEGAIFEIDGNTGLCTGARPLRIIQ